MLSTIDINFNRAIIADEVDPLSINNCRNLGSRSISVGISANDIAGFALGGELEGVCFLSAITACIILTCGHDSNITLGASVALNGNINVLAGFVCASINSGEREDITSSNINILHIAAAGETYGIAIDAATGLGNIATSGNIYIAMFKAANASICVGYSIEILVANIPCQLEIPLRTYINITCSSNTANELNVNRIVGFQAVVVGIICANGISPASQSILVAAKEALGPFLCFYNLNNMVRILFILCYIQYGVIVDIIISVNTNIAAITLVLLRVWFRGFRLLFRIHQVRL